MHTAYKCKFMKDFIFVAKLPKSGLGRLIVEVSR